MHYVSCALSLSLMLSLSFALAFLFYLFLSLTFFFSITLPALISFFRSMTTFHSLFVTALLFHCSLSFYSIFFFPSVIPPFFQPALYVFWHMNKRVISSRCARVHVWLGWHVCAHRGQTGHKLKPGLDLRWAVSAFSTGAWVAETQCWCQHGNINHITTL